MGLEEPEKSGVGVPHPGPELLSAWGRSLERAGVAGLVTAASLLFFGLARNAPPVHQLQNLYQLGSLMGPPVGVWIARRVLKNGHRYYAALLVGCGWIGMWLASTTMPGAPPAIWGGPLRGTPASVAWNALWVFVPVLLATMAQRSRPPGRLERALGVAASLPFWLLTALFLLLL